MRGAEIAHGIISPKEKASSGSAPLICNNNKKEHSQSSDEGIKNIWLQQTLLFERDHYS